MQYQSTTNGQLFTNGIVMDYQWKIDFNGMSIAYQYTINQLPMDNWLPMQNQLSTNGQLITNSIPIDYQ